MPYSAVSELPKGVKSALPSEAQSLWLRVFNASFEDSGDEDTARQAAWGAVKKAGWKKSENGKKWVKAAAEIEDATAIHVDGLRVLDFAEAMALPSATATRIYAEFRYITFGKPNKNKDGFLAEDITDEVVATLLNSPIYLQEDASDHPLKDKRATERAQYQVGTVAFAEKRDDGIYCIGSFQRDVLEDRGISPVDLDKGYSVSMEVMFDRAKAKYRSSEKLLAYQEAVASGVASPIGTPDDRTKYEARFIVPQEFFATALLRRGRNADAEADVLRVAASEDDMIEWSSLDYELYLQTTAEVSE